MCIVIVKPAGVDLPSEDTLLECDITNPDGAGFMYAREGVVEYYKGYKTVNGLTKRIKDNGLTKNDVIVYHFRIATHGNVDAGNCHPFPICNSYKRMRRVHSTCQVALAHNGVMSNLECDKMGLESDTMVFAKLLHDTGIPKMLREDEKNWDTVIESMVSGSRVVLLWGDGTCWMYGTGWVEADDDCLYSNRGYIKRKPVKNTYHQSGYYGASRFNEGYTGKTPTQLPSGVTVLTPDAPKPSTPSIGSAIPTSEPNKYYDHTSVPEGSDEAMMLHMNYCPDCSKSVVRGRSGSLCTSCRIVWTIKKESRKKEVKELLT